MNRSHNKFYLKVRFVYLLGFLILISCGQTGPLKLPTPEEPEKSQADGLLHLSK